MFNIKLVASVLTMMSLAGAFSLVVDAKAISKKKAFKVSRKTKHDNQSTQNSQLIQRNSRESESDRGLFDLLPNEMLAEIFRQLPQAERLLRLNKKLRVHLIDQGLFSSATTHYRPDINHLTSISKAISAKQSEESWFKSPELTLSDQHEILHSTVPTRQMALTLAIKPPCYESGLIGC